MPITSQQLYDWLTRLRVIHEPHAKRSERIVDLQNAAYLDVLKDMDPQRLGASVHWWCKFGKHFPKPADLRDKADELAADAEAAERARKLAIADGTDPGSQARNEVIRLVPDLDNRARRHFGDGDAVNGNRSEGYKRWLGELARMWVTMRSEGGFDALHEQRLAWKVGRQLEERGRQLLGLEPLAPLPPAPKQQRQAAVQREIDKIAAKISLVPPTPNRPAKPVAPDDEPDPPPKGGQPPAPPEIVDDGSAFNAAYDLDDLDEALP